MAEEQAATAAARPPAQSDTNKLLAALGYPVTLIALIMVLTDPGKKDDFVKYHAWQALFFGIAMWIGWVIPIIGWFLLGPVLWIISIYFAVQTYQGKYFEVPVIYNLAKKYIEGRST